MCIVVPYLRYGLQQMDSESHTAAQQLIRLLGVGLVEEFAAAGAALSFRRSCVLSLYLFLL